MSAKVDTRLRQRRIIDGFIKRLEGEELTLSQMERLTEKLVRLGPQVGPALIKKIARCRDEAAISRYLFALEYLDDDSLINPLLEILMKGEGDPAIKARILSTLRYFEVPIGGPIIYRLFPEALRQAASYPSWRITSYC